MITVVEPARSTRLTTLARVKSSLGISLADTSQDERLEPLIDDASAAIAGYCGRVFARESVTEALVGYGRTSMQLDRTPLVLVSAVRHEGTAVTDWEYYDKEAGFLFRECRFDDSRATDVWINRSPAPMPGKHAWQVDYLGGWLLASDNITPSGTLSADAADNSLNLGGDDTFPILASGENISVTGFATSGNNGRMRVVSRTPTKLVVTATLASEVCSGVARIVCANAPNDLERYCLMTVKAWYLNEQRNEAVTSERIGDWQAAYASEPFTAKDNFGLPPVVVAGLTRYIRIEQGY